MNDLKFTVDRPDPNTQEECNKRLLERNLLHGSTEVFHYQDKYYGGGDREHCPTAIDHNLKKLLELLKYGNYTYVGKAYDSDMYFSRQRITDKLWEGITKHRQLVAIS